jgi:hypothetical protein
MKTEKLSLKANFDDTFISSDNKKLNEIEREKKMLK